MPTLNARGEQMHEVLEGRNPEQVYKIFDAVRRIPRESGKEQQIDQFILEWAKERNLEVTTDPSGNIVIHVPATEGMEHVTPVCLQAHKDMVYTHADPQSEPDFINQPIDLEVSQENGRDFLHTKGKKRTLGADNAAGFAMAMGIVDDPTAKHGPIKILITSDEETGLTGAEAFKPENHNMVDTRVLINLDTPIANTLAVQCAGWNYLDGKIPLDASVEKNLENGKTYNFQFSGFEGGHSGDDVAKGRGNPNKDLGELLRLLPTGSRLISMDGGQATNGIPMQATMQVYVPNVEGNAWMQSVNQYLEDVRQKLGRPQIQLAVSEAAQTTSTVGAVNVATHQRVSNLLQVMPDGVQQMGDLPGVPDLSNTLATLKQDGSNLIAKVLVRGAKGKETAEHVAVIENVFNQNGFSIEHGSKGPGWSQDIRSLLVNQAQRAFRAITGQDPSLSGFHCTIETGPLVGDATKPNFDHAVSFGATVLDEHAPTERMDMQSLEKTYEVLKYLLKIVAREGMNAEPVKLLN